MTKIEKILILVDTLLIALFCFTVAKADPLNLWSDNGTSLYYNSGNVGIGTAVPGTTLAVVGSQSGSMTYNDVSYGGGGSPQLKLSTGTSSGSTAGAYMTLQGKLESWVDVVATNNTLGQQWMRFGNGQPQNTFSVQLLSDTASSILSTPFSIENTAPTGSFYIKANGNVGVGTTSPSSKLTVQGDINFTGNIYKNGVLFSGSSTSSTSSFVSLPANCLYIQTDSSGAPFCNNQLPFSSSSPLYITDFNADIFYGIILFMFTTAFYIFYFKRKA